MEIKKRLWLGIMLIIIFVVIVEILENYFLLPKEITVLLAASIPVTELRGAIPLGLYLGIDPTKTFLLAVLGNLMPILPALILLEPLDVYLKRSPFFYRFFGWLYERTRRRSRQIKKYGPLGLIFFTAIPLPMTGAWTAAIAASLFGIPIKFAFPAIMGGIVIAGVIMTFLGIGISVLEMGVSVFGQSF